MNPLKADAAGQPLADAVDAAHSLERLLDQPAAPTRHADPVGRHQGIRVGTLVGLEHGSPLISYADQPSSGALRALTIVDLQPADLGRRVVIDFEQGDPRRPIVIGLVRGRASDRDGTPRPAEVEVEADGRRVTVAAREQLVLKCGAASITLTAAGKILVQGAYVSARSSGVLRLKGGCVQIN